MLKKFVEYIRTLAIIGVCKNAGKTTVLNQLLKELNGFKVGVTSAGRDGEEKDLVFNTPKPQIIVQKGTIIATTEECLNNSEIEYRCLLKTGIATAMGEVFVVEAAGNGKVDVAGPTSGNQLKRIKEILFSFGCEKVIIDGAIDRKAIVSPDVADALILATGAPVSSDIGEIVAKTLHSVNRLTIPTLSDDNVINAVEKLRKAAKSGAIYEDGAFEDFDCKLAIDAGKEILECVKKKSRIYFSSRCGY